MNGKWTAVLLVLATTLAVAAYPLPEVESSGTQLDVNDEPSDRDRVGLPPAAPVIDAVFVLDTTGSMGSLIQTAKEKIWSIASTMAAADPSPQLRIGLVAYRDRGDAYVVNTVDLSGDLDSVYAQLMQFEAAGGGDGPESVNAALQTAVDQMSWADAGQAYRVIFLVGDAPPHMDYQGESQYPEIVAKARQRGIVVNAIQCGQQQATTVPWQAIARLGGGRYFQVDQAGGAISMTSPYDQELAELSAQLDKTRLYYGSREERARMAEKEAASEAIAVSAPMAARAQRGLFNLTTSGKASMLGQQELVDAVASGSVELDELESEELPATLRELPAEEREAHVSALAVERTRIESAMQELADKREHWVREALEDRDDTADSLEQKLYEAVAEQAETAGLDYAEGPAY